MTRSWRYTKPSLARAHLGVARVRLHTPRFHFLRVSASNPSLLIFAFLFLFLFVFVLSLELCRCPSLMLFCSRILDSNSAVKNYRNTQGTMGVES